jgi:hypothetical protein
VLETWIGGQRVYERGAPPVDASTRRYRRHPIGLSPSPIIGYDPTIGAIAGAALFYYSYREQGPAGGLVVMTAPQQLTARVEVDATYHGIVPWYTTEAHAAVDTFEGRYYGFGNDTDATGFATDPTQIEGNLGGVWFPGAPVHLSTRAQGVWLRERSEGAISAESGSAEGPVSGLYAGPHVEIVHDDRDTAYSTHTGGRRVLWSEAWLMQAGERSARFRAGASLTQFVPLYAPEVVLALRALGGVSAGDPAYATQFTLGGSDVLRGYLSNRLRGYHFAAGGAEVRFPIWGRVSGAAFGEVGEVFAPGESSALATSGGGGLRFGLPPDGAIRLRFDVGFSPDQWGIYFKFNEAY